MGSNEQEKNVDRYTSNEIIRNAMKVRGVLQTELADRLGMKQSSVSGNINRPRMGLDVFIEMMNAMDYDVAIVDRESGEVSGIVVRK